MLNADENASEIGIGWVSEWGSDPPGREGVMPGGGIVHTVHTQIKK